MIIEIGNQNPVIIETGIPSTSANMEVTTEDYMRISDYVDHPHIIDERNYTEEEISKCQELINFYIEMEEYNG